jgi:hypothetical protein
MTEQQHPITPPLELLKKWEDQWFDEEEHPDVLLIQAFQAGADQELEACCALALVDPCCGTKFQRSILVRKLREQRRPNPPSLKKQALIALHAVAVGANDMRDQYQDLNTIRRALEQLND